MDRGEVQPLADRHCCASYDIKGEVADGILAEKLHPSLEYIAAEVVWAVKQEMARTVEDVLARRVRALFLDARASIEMAPKVAEIMANELGKDQEWVDEQLDAYQNLARNYILD